MVAVVVGLLLLHFAVGAVVAAVDVCFFSGQGYFVLVVAVVAVVVAVVAVVAAVSGRGLNCRCCCCCCCC